MHFVYIIHSKKIDKYYVGESGNPFVRLNQHNESYFRNSWTSKASDWELVTTIEFKNIACARKAELFIKNMKSAKFIEKLIFDHVWLQEKFNSEHN